MIALQNQVSNLPSLPVSLPIPLQAMKNLLMERKNLIVKIGNTYEISRPLALELWKLLVEEVVRNEGTLKEQLKVEVATKEMVIVKLEVSIKIGNAEIQLSEVGEAYSDEKGGKDFVMARTAYTRAMKRLLERIAGEDFINRIILSLFDSEPASEQQKQLIKKLVKEGKINKEVIQELISEGRLPQEFSLKQALADGSLTKSQASVIIGKVLA